MRADKSNILAEDIQEFCCRVAVGGAVRRNGEALEETIKRADESMYQNKHVKR